jgi:hypothetical protein
MKARIPRAYQSLSERQRKNIADYATQIALNAAREQEEKDCRIILDLYMKMTCLILHDAFGFGEKRLTRYIANHRRLFAQQARLVKKGEQIAYMNERMAEIFRKDGFPQEFIDNLCGEVKVDD